MSEKARRFWPVLLVPFAPLQYDDSWPCPNCGHPARRQGGRSETVCQSCGRPMRAGDDGWTLASAGSPSTTPG
jgi:hypothetical protein